MILSTADAICAVDEHQRIVMWNEGAEALLGYTAEEVLNRPCYEVLAAYTEGGQLLCRHACHVVTATHQGRPVPHYTAVVRDKHGALRRLNVSILVLAEDDHGNPLIVHLMHDADASRRGEVSTPGIAAVPLSSGARSDGDDVPAPDPTPSWASLTAREKEVLRLLASGRSTREIAEDLSIAPVTVRNHVQSILEKLNVHSRVEAVVYAFRHRII